MAQTYKNLAQLAPSPALLTLAYVVPPTASASVNSFVVANRGAVPARYRISVALNGAADALKQYLAYDVSLKEHITASLTLGVHLVAGDEVRVYDELGAITFNLFGSETL